MESKPLYLCNAKLEDMQVIDGPHVGGINRMMNLMSLDSEFTSSSAHTPSPPMADTPLAPGEGDKGLDEDTTTLVQAQKSVAGSPEEIDSDLCDDCGERYVLRPDAGTFSAPLP